MCGVCGVVQAGGCPGSVQLGIDRLGHRGPDAIGEQYWAESGMSVAFGHTRLAINDITAAGQQPMSTDDGSVAMIFNGEIYNYPELRSECIARGRRFRSSMDGEVILHLWAMDGVRCLGRLNGIFALAITDFKARTVTLARDPLGVKPLYYTTSHDGRLVFASELNALQALAGDLGGFDTTALAQFLTFLWIPDPRTPYLRARTVEPGTALQWARGLVTPVQYRPPLVPDPCPVAQSADTAVAQGSAVLAASVKRQLLSDVPIGLMASGGIDSGLLWSFGEAGLTRAFCVEWNSGGEGEGLGEDAAAVRRCQQVFGTPVTFLQGQDWDEQRLPVGGDLSADPAFELTRAIAATARAWDCKVLLSGQGGDELLGGYRRHRAAQFLGRLRLPPSASTAAARAISRMGGRSIPAEYAARLVAALGCRDPLDRYLRLCTYSNAEQRATVLGCSAGEVSDAVVSARHAEVFRSLPPELSFLRKVMTVDLRVYLPGLGLAYADRAAMEEGVEVRVPLLDLDVVQWSMTLPDDFLIRRGETKWLAKRIAARRLPPEVVYRPKRGFGAPARHIGTAERAGARQTSYFRRAADIVTAYVGGQGALDRRSG